MVTLARHVPYGEAPREGALLERKQAGIGYLVQHAVTKDLYKRLVIGNHYEIVAPLSEVP